MTVTMTRLQFRRSKRSVICYYIRRGYTIVVKS